MNKHLFIVGMCLLTTIYSQDFHLSEFIEVKPDCYVIPNRYIPYIVPKALFFKVACDLKNLKESELKYLAGLAFGRKDMILTLENERKELRCKRWLTYKDEIIDEETEAIIQCVVDPESFKIRESIVLYPMARMEAVPEKFLTDVSTLLMPIENNPSISPLVYPWKQ